jgi:hypothetical protein
MGLFVCLLTSKQRLEMSYRIIIIKLFLLFVLLVVAFLYSCPLLLYYYNYFVLSTYFFALMCFPAVLACVFS